MPPRKSEAEKRAEKRRKANAARQRRLKDRRHELGQKRLEFWVTPEEGEYLTNALECYRAAQDKAGA